MSKEIPIIPIKLDKQRRVKLDGNAFLAIEEITGKNAFMGEVFRTMSMTDLITVMWQGLRWEDPDLTREQVAGWFHAGVMGKWMKVVEQAWVDAIDMEEEKGPLAQEAPEPPKKS